MKVLIINPPRVNNCPVTREDRLEYSDYGEVFTPLTLLYTAAILEKQGQDVRFIDANGFDKNLEFIKEKIKSFYPDFVITRCGFDVFEGDLKVLKIAKEINPNCITATRCKIISETPSILKDVLSRSYVDFFIMQELEVAVPDMIKKLKKAGGVAYYKNNGVVINKRLPEIKNLDKLPFPAYHLLPNIKCYQTGTQRPIYTLLFSSRGCPYNCTFCPGHDTYKVRSAKSIANELEWLKNEYGLKRFYFFDDNFSCSRKRTIKICNELIKQKLNLSWSCGTRIDRVDNEVLSKMSKAGNKMIAYGVESGSQTILNNVDKRITLEQIKKANKITKENGILSYFMIVLGLPGETKQTIRETVKFVNETNPSYCQFCTATPFPNTQMFKFYHEKGQIITYNWTKYNPLGKSVISTPELSAEECDKMKYWAYKSFIFRPKYLLSHIKPSDLEWNINGLRFFFNRAKQIISKNLIR